MVFIWTTYILIWRPRVLKLRIWKLSICYLECYITHSVAKSLKGGKLIFNRQTYFQRTLNPVDALTGYLQDGALETVRQYLPWLKVTRFKSLIAVISFIRSLKLLHIRRRVCTQIKAQLKTNNYRLQHFTWRCFAEYSN